MIPTMCGFLFDKKMKSKDILYIIDKYINRYLDEKNSKYETIYRIPSNEVALLGSDFIRDDASRVFFVFID